MVAIHLRELGVHVERRGLHRFNELCAPQLDPVFACLVGDRNVVLLPYVSEITVWAVVSTALLGFAVVKVCLADPVEI